MITKPLKTDDEVNEEENGKKKYKYSFLEIAQKISDNKEEESLTNTEKEEEN